MGTDSATPVFVRTPVAQLGTRCPCCGTVLPSAARDRRFTLSDAMILVAASAVAFVIVRPLVTGRLHREPAWASTLAWVLGVLVVWTPSVLLLRLRSPRPPVRRLWRQPGFTASLAGTAIIGFGLLAFGLLSLMRVARHGLTIRTRLGLGGSAQPAWVDPGWWLAIVLYFGAAVGPAVIGAWLILAVSGRRRVSRGWLDPLGRVLGLAWIVLFVIHCCARLGYLQD